MNAEYRNDDDHWLRPIRVAGHDLTICEAAALRAALDTAITRAIRDNHAPQPTSWPRRAGGPA